MKTKQPTLLNELLHIIQIILAAEQIRDTEMKSLIIAAMAKECREFLTGYKTPITKKAKL